MFYLSEEILAFGNLKISLSLSSENNFNFKKFKSSNTMTYSKYLIFQYLAPKSTEDPHKDRVSFSVPHLYSLRNGFKEMIELLTTEEVFLIYEDEETSNIKVKEEYKKHFVKVTGAAKSLILRPAVKVVDSTLTEEAGVLMIVGNLQCKVFLSLEVFLSIATLMQEFNLIQSAQNLVTMYNSTKNRSTRSSKDVIEE